MQLLDLSKYISYGLFLKNIVDYGIFDLVVFEENMFFYDGMSNDIVSNSYPFDILFLDKELENSDNLSNVWDTIFMKYKNVLCICDNMNIEAILPKNYWDDKNISFTCVNLFVGVSSFWNKIKSECDDVLFAINNGFKVLESFDLVNFFELLKLDVQKKYIRVCSVQTLWSLFNAEQVIVEKWLLSSLGQWICWDMATVLVAWNYLFPMLQACKKLQEENCFVDLFSIVDYNWGLWGEFLKSIQCSWRLIIVLDQREEEWLKSIFIDVLRKFDISNLQVEFIFPKYESVSTVLDEYKFQQAGFDMEWFMDMFLRKE